MARYHKNSVRVWGRGECDSFASYKSVQFHSIKSALSTEQATVSLRFSLPSSTVQPGIWTAVTLRVAKVWECSQMEIFNGNYSGKIGMSTTEG